MPVSNHFAVLLRSDTRPSADQIRRAFRSFSHLTDADAIRLAANAEGVLLRHLSSDEGRAFHRALKSEGVDAALISESELAQLAIPIRLNNIEMMSDAVLVHDQIGRTRRMAWSEISLIAMGSLLHVGFAASGLGHDESRQSVFTRAWQKHPSNSAHKLQRDFHIVLEFILRDDTTRFQINASDFLFGQLTPANNSSTQKIIWLAREFISRTPAALLNRGARDVRDGAGLVRGYATSQSFHDEIVWLLWNRSQQNRGS